MIPRTCLTLAETEPGRLGELIRRFAGEPAYIEVRLDYLERPAVPVPPPTDTCFVATCRPAREGGKFQGSEEERIQLLRRAAELGYTWIDLEADVRRDPAEFRPARVLRSHHEFRGVGAGVREEWHRLRQVPGDGYKLAVTPSTLEEVGALFALLRHLPSDPPRVLLGMGDLAQPTRWWGPWLGNAWTYVVPHDNAAVAPGQFTLEEARFLYDRRTGPPDLYLVLGRRPTCLQTALLRLNGELRKHSAAAACLWWSVGAEVGDPWAAVESWDLPVRGMNLDFWSKEEQRRDAATDEQRAPGPSTPVRVWEKAFLGTLQRAGGPTVRTAFVLGKGRAARRAAGALGEAGCRVWRDTRLPGPGESWRGDATVVAGPAVLVTFAGAREVESHLRTSSPEWRLAVQVWLDLCGEESAVDPLREWFPCLQGWAGAADFQECFVRETLAVWMADESGAGS